MTALAASLAVSHVLAAVSPQEAETLKSSLTPLGAELENWQYPYYYKDGNADKWSGQ